MRIQQPVSNILESKGNCEATGCLDCDGKGSKPFRKGGAGRCAHWKVLRDNVQAHLPVKADKDTIVEKGPFASYPVDSIHRRSY